MGSWNGTCGLSNLPIEAGDDILLFVLKESNLRRRNTLGGGFSYPTGLYTPVGLPVHGKYDDYGGIEHVTTNGDFMFNFLTNDRRFAIRLNDGVDIKPASIEEVLNDCIERGHTDYKFMLVRKDVLEAMKADPVTEFAEFDGQFEAFSEAYRSETAKAKEAQGEEHAHHVFFHAQLAEIELPEILAWNNVFLSLLESSDIPSLKNVVRDIALKPEMDLHNHIIDVVYVSRLLGDLRKFWTPQSGTGSQATNHDVHLALASTIATVCEEHNRKWEEEYGE